jgi:hypothetical protein
MSDLVSMLAAESVSVAELERIHLVFRDGPTFEADAIFAMRQLDSGLAWRAATLLRRLAQDGRLGDDSLVRIAESADEVTHWIARLNLCQLFSVAGCPRSARESLFPFLEAACAEKRVLVRAWAVSAYATFADDPRYRRGVLEMIRKAKKERAKAMMARLRHIRVPRGLPDAAHSPP